jgi:hypothetical protein
MWQEKARWRGVSVVCTVDFGAVPMGVLSSSKRMTSSEVFIVFSRYSAGVEVVGGGALLRAFSLATYQLGEGNNRGG